MTIKLAQIKDLLLPALWSCQWGGRKMDMVIDFDRDCLDVIDLDTKLHLFTITREEIENGSYKTTFASKIKKALNIQDWD